MKISELLKTESDPLVVPESIPAAEGSDHFKDLTREILDKARTTPWFQEQRKAISVYKEKVFKLRKGIQFGFIIYPRGTSGFILSQDALEVFQSRFRERLRDGLGRENAFLCGIEDYVWVLPIEYININKKKIEQEDLFL